MNTVEVLERPPVLLRIAEGVLHHFLLGSVVGREELWLTIACHLDLQVLRDTAEGILEDPEGSEDVIEHGLALMGLRWDALTPPVAVAQVSQWKGAPPWMDRLPKGVVWTVRNHVFGDELTRVPAALTALDKFYVPEGPVSAEMLRGSG